MKKEPVIKYPHSASLFQFCRKVLDHKFGGIRVIDQDVGQILGFDPADCSHWKKGKKNIRSIQAMKSIAEHLGVDEKLVVDVACGEITDQEAFHEYSGYGEFTIDGKLFDAARKDFYRKNASTWTPEKDLEFKGHFNLNERKIDAIVQGIHDRLNFKEAPLYLPEIVASYPDIVLKPYETDAADAGEGKVTLAREGQSHIIHYPADVKMRPYMRYQIAKAMAGYFFEREGLAAPEDLGDYSQQIADIQANLFAAKLLTPAGILRKVLQNVNVTKDIVTQLAEIFWVSKTFMNARLKDILQNTPEI